MKRFILLILILQGLLCHAMSYNGSYSGGGTEYRRMGYTTNYASGNFSTSAYNRGVATTTTYYGGSYTPTSGSGAGRPGVPRRSPERPKPDLGGGWEGISDWWRMHYKLFGSGYNPDWPGDVDSDYWEEFFEAYPEYRSYVEEWFKNNPGHPNDPFATPIGEPVIPSVLLAVGYFAYKVKTRRLKVVREE